MKLSPSEDLADSKETRGWPFAVGSGIIGWVLDAFDFFVVIFLFDTLAANFHIGKAAIVSTLALTLAMRSAGALIFGSLGGHCGRKPPRAPATGDGAHHLRELRYRGAAARLCFWTGTTWP